MVNCFYLRHYLKKTGPCGSGKTTISNELALRLNIHFLEGDEFHPQANIDKMSRGIPLDDADREFWLQNILIALHFNPENCSQAETQNNNRCVLACSALKRSYRDVLRSDGQHCIFLMLVGDPHIIAKRLEHRQNHFMKSGMLDSQIATMEIPDTDEKDTFIINVNGTFNDILTSCLHILAEEV